MALARMLLRTGGARALRESLGLSQATVAESVPCTRQAYSRWETGERVPSPTQARRVARVLSEMGELAEMVGQ